MAEDYLSDREQEEALRIWWRENWRWIIGGVVLGLGLLGAWRYYEVYSNQQAEQAARMYAEFKGAVEANDIDQASRLLTDLTSDYANSAYAQQGRLLMARIRVDAGAVDEAITLLRTVAETADDEELAQIAGQRTARLLIQQGAYDDALALLDVEAAGAFAPQVREIRGDAMAAKGDQEGARAEYAAALASNTDAQVDRTLLELKLQNVGGGDAGLTGGQP